MPVPTASSGDAIPRYAATLLVARWLPHARTAMVRKGRRSTPAEGFTTRAAARFLVLDLGDHFLDAQRVAGSSECGHIVRQIAGRAVVVPGRDHPSRWAGRVPRWYRSIWWGVSLAALRR